MGEMGILGPHDKVELINGEIIHMSPVGTTHQATIDKSSRILNRFSLDDAIIRVQGPIQINDLSEPEPDILLLKAKEDFYADQHPGPTDTLLLIEVSNSSLEYDKTIKLQLYATADVPVYWVVNIPDNQVEVYQNPDGDIYKSISIFKLDETIPLLDFPNCNVAVSTILTGVK